MKIAVNTRLLLANRLDGIGWFTYETLRIIVQSHPEHIFYFIFDRTPDPKFIFADNVKPVVLFPQARHPVLWYVYFEISTAFVIRRLKPDVYLSTDGWIPLRLKIPVVDVVHDINFEHSNDYLPWVYQRYMKHFFPRFVSKARRIATVSEFSKHDIATTYNVPENKIDVVYNGAHEAYLPLSEAEQATVRSQRSNGCRYFIFVSTISKRKNLQNTIRAFDAYRRSTTENVKLLVVGGKMWWPQEMSALLDSLEHKDDIIFCGRCDESTLAQLLASSIALVYVSLFEGFGIPIIEAFHAETAVITSNVTSMPEVAGDAALIVDPYNVDDIANAMSRLASDKALRQRMIERGRERGKLFGWHKTAASLWQSILKTVEVS